jgi:hypothetical protein
MSDNKENRADNSRFRQIAIKGDRYREENDYPYFGETLTLSLKPVKEGDLLPLQTLLMEKLGMDLDDADEKIDNAKPSDLDAEFVRIMQEIAVFGIDRFNADAKGMSEDDVREVLDVGVEEDEDGDVVGLVGGLSLEIAQDVIGISQDTEGAEKFRGDGGSE